MKGQLVMLALLMLLLVQAPAQGEKKIDPKPIQRIVLSVQEQQQLTQAAQTVQARDADFKRSLNAIAECPLEPDKALEVVAKIQTAIARSQAAQAELDKLIAIFQAHHSCPDCRLTPDGKALSKVDSEEKQK